MLETHASTGCVLTGATAVQAVRQAVAEGRLQQYREWFGTLRAASLTPVQRHVPAKRRASGPAAADGEASEGEEVTAGSTDDAGAAAHASKDVTGCLLLHAVAERWLGCAVWGCEPCHRANERGGGLPCATVAHLRAFTQERDANPPCLPGPAPSCALQRSAVQHPIQCRSSRRWTCGGRAAGLAVLLVLPSHRNTCCPWPRWHTAGHRTAQQYAHSW